MVRIRDASADEAPALEALQRRSSDVWPEYREQFCRQVLIPEVGPFRPARTKLIDRVVHELPPQRQPFERRVYFAGERSKFVAVVSQQGVHQRRLREEGSKASVDFPAEALVTRRNRGGMANHDDHFHLKGVSEPLA